MKAAVVIFGAALLAWLGWFLAKPDGEPPAAVTARVQDPPDATSRDGVEVFRKAFWKRPTTGDRILHAERREWSDGGGVEKWQWFIVLEPSPELLKYLREDNAFSLVPVSAPVKITDPPAWFSFLPGECDALRSPGGEMQLFFGKTDKILHATATGGGFATAAEAPVPVRRRNAAHPGRLPDAPPPIPPAP